VKGLAALATVALALSFAGEARPSPVNGGLPWHQRRVDARERLLPWTGYSRILRLGWDFVAQRLAADQRAGPPVYLRFAVFDGRTLQGRYWQHNPASLYASFVDSLLPWYAYSGDRRAIALVRQMLDYQLAHETTPAGWAWPRVPFATSCAGQRTYGGCLAGRPRSFHGGLEPDKVGLLGLGYARFYELTGNRRYLQAALWSARALARHVRPGNARHTPWPFRVDGPTGGTLAGAEYGGAVVGPVWLLDELIRLHAGDTASFRRARDLAWRWITRYPLNPRSAAWNRWSGYYEDVRYDPRDLNQATPTITALYLLTRSRPRSVDDRWEEHVRDLLAWVRRSFGRGPFHGAWAIDEQRAPGKKGCCSTVGLGSDTARWAAANALLAARTGDQQARSNALRSLAYATYFMRGDGRVACCGARGRFPFWFSDGYGDYLGNFSWALGALPALAPAGEDHLLGSTSVVREVSYGRDRLAFRTYDRHSTEVLRLSYRPTRVLADGRALDLRRNLLREGFVVRPLAGGDVVVRVRHDRARQILIEGSRD